MTNRDATDPNSFVTRAELPVRANEFAPTKATGGSDAVMAAGATDAAMAATLFAVDPAGTGGVNVRAFAGPARDRWLAALHDLVPPTTPWRRVPLQVSDGRLLGGLDIPATLRAGRPVADRGILAEADGGIALLAMAERIAHSTIARITAALDTGEVVAARDGLSWRTPARIGVVALDEGLADDEGTARALLDRMAFHIDLTAARHDAAVECWHLPHEIAAARARLPDVRAPDETLDALCEVAMALGIASVRAPLLALRVARIAAALAARDFVAEEDAALAGRLVLAPRATRLPPTEANPEQASPPEEKPTEQDDPPRTRDGDDADTSNSSTTDDSPGRLEDIVLSAAKAAIPAHLLAMLESAQAEMRGMRPPGRAGAFQRSAQRGRPAGMRRGEPRAGGRINVVETLRAAAPWQRLRQHERGTETAQGISRPRIEIRREDFHVARFQQRAETTTIFVVDASGSSAMHRLAEAKGAAELLLADCYIRRDRVAVIAFRDRGAQILLPPTRSLVRAKRSLAGLPGGGGTPLASGIDAALAIAVSIQRRGGTPTVVFLTDGRANIARDGTAGRTLANADAVAAARAMRAAGIRALLVDTSPRPQAVAAQLSREMGARYVALPNASADTLSSAIRAPALSRSAGIANQ
jgi:magnesium chelatase subunit D